ncbi:5-formyltetrahydrofolate cyclo-ligase [Psychroflexus lacisalsi]|jgi:5-formyltetrahydrofolate cyclo-ligase|uniref:5-formyltetrahydrofolate cyclo-ligase n=1 Tax=Psychroflexus lacisalsi TaxID=503928 RepID=A0ABN1K196_9FLAO|nr:5-formyltetrahydrofolate cyclo-ligase [Psychroflexus lacisalsi]MBZ9620796.1 5-formyltetrahydrofolate cyclo-ligase [Psychroflexus lacisalsi]
MNKEDLRKKYIIFRKELSISEMDDMSLKIANQALQLDIWDFEFYHLFLSISNQKEINTEYLLQIIFGKDANAVVPKVNGKTLEHFLLTDTTKLKLSKWDIPEPVKGIKIEPNQIDVIFLPLLAYDKQGNRIGYGKGFYDKFLVDCRPETLKIGLSFFEPEEENIEVSDHDVALDYCITPENIHKFKSN